MMVPEYPDAQRPTWWRFCPVLWQSWVLGACGDSMSAAESMEPRGGSMPRVWTPCVGGTVVVRRMVE